MRYISMFSGIEAASVAWESLGWEAVVFSEIDPFASAVLAHRFPDVPNVGDMVTHDWTRYKGMVDLVVGGPPCQAFSVAGLRRSLGDERGNLSLEFIRAIHAINPRYAIVENVPGWLSARDNAFGCFLGGLVGANAPLVPAKGQRWSDAGMVVGPLRTAAWRILDAQYFGVAQRRRRVFVVSSLRDGANPAAVLFERKSLSGHFAPSREKGEGTAPSLTRSPYRDHVDQESGLIVNSKVTAHDDPRRFDNKGIHGGGNHGDLHPSLRNTNPAVLLAFDWQVGGHSAIHRDAVCVQEAQTGVREYDTAGSLRANAPGSQPTGSLVMAFTERTRADGRNLEASVDVAYALTNPGSGGRTDNRQVMANAAVRRLTPRECERLQGFPDDFSLVPYRGKPATDGPRYRALGNSMATPVVKWIGLRIAMVEKRL